MRDNLMKMLEVRNKSETEAEIYIYGDIVANDWQAWCDDDQYPKNVAESLAGVVDKDIHVYINSCGGNVFAGNAIYNILRRCRNKNRSLTVHIDSVAASIASVIAMAGDTVIMPKNSFLMIHKASCFAVGNSDDLRKTADDLERIEESIVGTYTEHLNSGRTREEVVDMMKAETWLTADEAAALFVSVETIAAVDFAAKATEQSFNNAPQLVKNALNKTTAKIADAENIQRENIKRKALSLIAKGA